MNPDRAATGPINLTILHPAQLLRFGDLWGHRSTLLPDDDDGENGYQVRCTFDHRPMFLRRKLDHSRHHSAFPQRTSVTSQMSGKSTSLAVTACGAHSICKAKASQTGKKNHVSRFYFLSASGAVDVIATILINVFTVSSSVSFKSEK